LEERSSEFKSHEVKSKIRRTKLQISAQDILAPQSDYSCRVIEILGAAASRRCLYAFPMNGTTSLDRGLAATQQTV
jgi:hypothetical protein